MPERDPRDQVAGLPDGELAGTCRDLRTGISLMRPGSPMRGPASACLAAATAELARRAGCTAAAETIPSRPGQAPGSNP
jgi:hypothetical protein